MPGVYIDQLLARMGWNLLGVVSKPHVGFSICGPVSTALAGLFLSFGQILGEMGNVKGVSKLMERVIIISGGELSATSIMNFLACASARTLEMRSLLAHDAVCVLALRLFGRCSGRLEPDCGANSAGRVPGTNVCDRRHLPPLFCT